MSSHEANQKDPDGWWDVFIAYAGPDREHAHELYQRLAGHCEATWDDCLKPGDRWNLILPQMLERSRIVAVLVSQHTGSAHYEGVEVADVIELVRRDPEHHRLVPVILDEGARLPYGTSTFKSLAVEKNGGMAGVANELLQLSSFLQQAGERRAATRVTSVRFSRSRSRHRPSDRVHHRRRESSRVEGSGRAEQSCNRVR